MTIQTKLPLRPENSHFTQEQWEAIYDYGDNVLVSASAGSGKTTVLVQRVIEKIKSGVNVDELLIVTYTEAAAKEMKQRIQVAIQKAVTDEPDEKERQHLTKQLSLLPTASISTLHAFCLKVIQQYYYLIHIDPVFRMMTDETEMLLMKEEVWSNLREELYGDMLSDFFALTENFSNDRNDDGLMEMIFSIHLFASANPDPKKWLDQLVSHYDVSEDLRTSPLYENYMRPTILEELSLAKEQINRLSKLIEGETEFVKTLKTLQSDQELLNQLQESLEQNRLDDFYEILHTAKFARIGQLTKLEGADEVSPVSKELYNQVIKKERDDVKEQVKKIETTYFKQSPKDMLNILQVAKPLVEELVRVTKLFLEAYTDEKAQRHTLDFNDLEHLTLQILRKEAPDGYSASEASLYFRRQFKEIMVDEYQDINRLQEAILFWLRVDNIGEGNLFMVGDVKQSIYAFRLADPTLFIEKYDTFCDEYTKDSIGSRIILAENFRSRSSVLDFTNLVFKQLMNAELGQIDYDDKASLVVGNKSYPTSQEHHTEILIYESQLEEESALDDLSFHLDTSTEGELHLVASKIKELITNKFPLFDKKKGESRPISYSDIVLLTPTKKNNLEIMDILGMYDIPILVNDTQNYFQTTEIRMMISLLQLIDNPYQDIPLASVLRSPIVGIKENDLVYIKKHSPVSFYDALEEYLETEHRNTLSYQKIKVFHEQFLNWREMARRKPLAELIWSIYNETDLLDYVGGLPSGEQRQANLHALYHRAAAYEEMNFKGLYQFIRFIEKMQEKNKDLAAASQMSEGEDAIRVMTIHASKGLEFPVVFVLDMSKQFNLMDINQRPYIFDEKLGMGMKYLDVKTRVKYDTFVYNVIRQEKRKKILAEEMRKLYVALTRAEEKLFLVGSCKNQTDLLNRWSKTVNEEEMVLSSTNRLRQKSLMDWIGMTLIRHPLLHQQFPSIQVDTLRGLSSTPAQFKLTFYEDSDLVNTNSTADKKTSETKAKDKPNPTLLKQVVDRLDFTYDEIDATKTTSYQSVSEVKRLFEDPDNQELPTLELMNRKKEKAYRQVTGELAKPKFLTQEVSVSAAEVGSAVHLVMQLIPLNTRPSKESIENLIQELVSNQVLSQAVTKKIDISMILRFFDSELGQILLKEHEYVTREQPFSMLLPAKDLYDGYQTKEVDTVLIHGIIDGYIHHGKDVILYDFKTDHVSNENKKASIETIKKRYQGQIRLYQLALEEVLGKSVTKTMLVLLKTGDTISF